MKEMEGTGFPKSYRRLLGDHSCDLHSDLREKRWVCSNTARLRPKALLKGLIGGETITVEGLSGNGSD